MKLIHKDIALKSKSDVFSLFVIGDSHIGKYNCAESHLKNYIDHIKKTPDSLWLGGGDICDCITPQDLKRFDARALPDWLFSGPAASIRDALADIALQERRRASEFLDPIKGKCLGMIMGNHEHKLMQYSGNAHHYILCEELDTIDLTDLSFIRLRFFIKGKSSVVTLLIAHGQGGGRSAGSEPNHLARLSQWAEADIILRGHSHTFRIEPPQVFLYIPRSGQLPDELLERSVHKANWGGWVKSYAAGPSTYDSRACYPARPLQSLVCKIKPFSDYSTKHCGVRQSTRTKPRITIQECDYENKW